MGVARLRLLLDAMPALGYWLPCRAGLAALASCIGELLLWVLVGCCMGELHW